MQNLYHANNLKNTYFSLAIKKMILAIFFISFIVYKEGLLCYDYNVLDWSLGVMVDTTDKEN